MKDPRSPATERSRFRSRGPLGAPELDLQWTALKERDGIDAVLRELQRHTEAADRQPQDETDRVLVDLDER